MELRLSALPRDACAYISGVDGRADMARRLEELGMVPGTAVCCELVSPAGDPAAYRVRGALIALRRRDAELVSVVLPGAQEGPA